MMTSSRSAPWVLCGLGIFSLLPFRGRRRPSRLAPAPGSPPPRPQLHQRPRGLLLGRLLLRGLALAAALGLFLGRLDQLGLGLADRHALGVHRLGLLLGDQDIVLDAPAALGDAGALADLVAQVVELRAADIAAGSDLELLDLRRVQREGSLHPDTERLLPHGEGLANAAALAFEHDALEDLGPLAAPFDDLEVNAHAVAGAELRALLQVALLEAFDDSAHQMDADAASPASAMPKAIGTGLKKCAHRNGPRRREM